MVKANNYLAFFGANENLIGKSKLTDVLPALQVVALDYELNLKYVSDWKIAVHLLRNRVDNN
jgi:hypothetical protein